ncbi:MAG: FecR domain-containing protein, partial [Cyanobacteria bacterium J06633_8]
MFRKLVPLAIVTLWGVVVMTPPQKASASTPLTRAVVKKLHNWVQLMPRNRPKRRARRRDSMNPGDGLATGRASLADLRFNDGSLARIGERAVFRFLPRTRTFRLSNGTVLLLIPPGQGRTRVRTRSAAATIRGSALFVRYDKETDTTVVGSLTNSGIEVFNKDESRSQVLKAGQFIVVVKGRIQGLYNFDLRTFYDTSDLVRGLDLTNPSDTASSDPAIASVQAETSEAVAKQEPIVGDKIVENPSFLELSPVASEQPSEQVAQENLPVNTLVETGQVITDTPKKNEDKSFNNNTSTPQTTLTSPSNGGSPTPATPTKQPKTGSASPTPVNSSPQPTPTIPTTPTTPTTGSASPTPVNSSPQPTPTTPTTGSPSPTPVNSSPQPTPTIPTTPTTPTTGSASPTPVNSSPQPTPTIPTIPTTPTTGSASPTPVNSSPQPIPTIPTTPTTPTTGSASPMPQTPEPSNGGASPMPQTPEPSNGGASPMPQTPEPSNGGASPMPQTPEPSNGG